MTWLQKDDRVVLSGRVDEIAKSGGGIYVELEGARCISRPTSTGIGALVRVHKYQAIPETAPHLTLADLWRTGDSRNQVMLLGTLVKEYDGGLVQVEFTNTFPTEPLRLTIGRDSVIFGKAPDA